MWAANSLSYDEAIADVRKQIDAEQNELGKLQIAITDGRRSLRESIQTTHSEIDAMSRDLETLEREIQSVTAEIEKSQKESHISHSEFDRIWESLQFNRKEFRDLYSLTLPEKGTLKNPIDAGTPSVTRSDQLIPLLQQTHKLYLEFFQKASRISVRKTQVYGENGSPIEARVLQTGLLGGICWAKKEIGLANVKPGVDHIQLLSEGLSKNKRRLLRSSSSQESGHIPVLLDVSQGMAISQLSLNRGWKEFFVSGGMVMYPLVFIAVVAFLMIGERCLFYLLFTMSNSALRKNLTNSLNSRNYTEALTLTNSHTGLSKRFWSRSIELLNKQTTNLEEAFQHVIIAEIPTLERFLTTLAVFAAICPLLGLLGTVSGMIKTFDVITIFGTGKSGMLSQGISEALVTTQVGLVIAIPILLAHAVLSRQSKTIVGTLDRTAGALVELVKEETAEPMG